MNPQTLESVRAPVDRHNYVRDQTRAGAPTSLRSSAARRVRTPEAERVVGGFLATPISGPECRHSRAGAAVRVRAARLLLRVFSDEQLVALFRDGL